MPRIRPFEATNEEYAGVVALANAVWPELPETVEGLRHLDGSRDPERLFQRLVLEVDGRIAAVGVYMESEWSHLPGKYFVQILTHPEHRRRGYATRLYEHILDALAPRNPLKLAAATHEDEVAALAMLARHGYRQVLRMPVAILDVAAFDSAPFEEKVRRTRESGIEIRALAEIRRDDPEWRRRYFELDSTLVQDLPSADPQTRPPFEVWARRVFDSPAFMPEAGYVALDGDEWVGVSQLWRNLATREVLHQGLTGVKRSHRRRGIALALKLRTIEFAKAYGARRIRTDNEQDNPMFQINLALGFKPHPADLDFERPWEGAR